MIFDEANPGRELLRYLQDLEALFTRYSITDNAEKKKWLTHYPGVAVADFWESLAEFADANSTYEQLKTAIIKQYPDADANRKYERMDIERVVGKYAREISSLAELRTYYREFYPKAQFLESKKRLSGSEISNLFSKGFPDNVWEGIMRRLQIKLPDHYPSDPYLLNEIHEAVQFVLQGTNRGESLYATTPQSYYFTNHQPSMPQPASDLITIKPEPSELSLHLQSIEEKISQLAQFQLQNRKDRYSSQPHHQNLDQQNMVQNAQPLASFAQSQVPTNVRNYQHQGPKARPCEADTRQRLQNLLAKSKAIEAEIKSLQQCIAFPIPKPKVRLESGKLYKARYQRKAGRGPQSEPRTSHIPILDPLPPKHELYMPKQVRKLSKSPCKAARPVPNLENQFSTTEKVQNLRTLPSKPKRDVKSFTPKFIAKETSQKPTQQPVPRAIVTETLQKLCSKPREDVHSSIPKFMAKETSQKSPLKAKNQDKDSTPLPLHYAPPTMRNIGAKPDVRKRPKDRNLTSLLCKPTNTVSILKQSHIHYPSNRPKSSLPVRNSAQTHGKQIDKSLPLKCARESAPIRSIYPIINHQLEVECVLDSGSQIISMSEAICQQSGLAYDPTMVVEMQSSNGTLNNTLGIARDVPFIIGNITLYLQVHVIRESAYDVLLGRPFDILTQSIVRNYADESQSITIHDPNTGKRATIPTHPRQEKYLETQGLG